ncbi:hypothetical protein [Mastigocladopsis repens]|nr:hypothetical protein [Mastigocladopsis repens]
MTLRVCLRHAKGERSRRDSWKPSCSAGSQRTTDRYYILDAKARMTLQNR